MNKKFGGIQKLCNFAPKTQTHDLMRYLLLALSILSTLAVARTRNATMSHSNAFVSADSAEIAENRQQGDMLLLYQRNTGGWPKNIDMEKPLDDDEREQVLADKTKEDDSTIDNNATTWQMQLLAKVYQKTGDQRYKDGFNRGLNFLLEGQYPSGGWPQVWPKGKGYQKSITYNDDAMVNVLVLLRGVSMSIGLFGGDLVDDEMRSRCDSAYQKGIECVLETQIIVNGKPTIWSQQYDNETLLPTFARSYELPAFCPRESARIVQVLMEMNNPDDRVKAAVHGAVEWMESHKIEGYRYIKASKDRTRHAELVPDPEAEPIWARYYDLQTEKPFVCDRDGIPHANLEDIGQERRDGYLWYDMRPKRLLKQYNNWKAKYEPDVK